MSMYLEVRVYILCSYMDTLEKGSSPNLRVQKPGLEGRAMKWAHDDVANHVRALAHRRADVRAPEHFQESYP